MNSLHESEHTENLQQRNKINEMREKYDNDIPTLIRHMETKLSKEMEVWNAAEKGEWYEWENNPRAEDLT